MNRFLIVSLAALAFTLAGPSQQTAIAQDTKPAPPSNLTATDHPWDNGEELDLAWDAPAIENEGGEYFILQTIAKVGDQLVTHDFKIIDSAPSDATSMSIEVKHHLKLAAIEKLGDRIDFETILATGEYKFTVGYLFQIVSVSADGDRSSPAQTAEITYATMQPFDLGRLALLLVTIIICGAVIFWIRRITPALICVAPFTDASSPFRLFNRSKVRTAMEISPNPSVMMSVKPTFSLPVIATPRSYPKNSFRS